MQLGLDVISVVLPFVLFTWNLGLRSLPSHGAGPVPVVT